MIDLMSTATGYPINYSEPRTIWTITLQLVYTIIAMLPFYFYLTNLVSMPAEGRYLLEYLPIGVGIIIFFFQLLLNEYYWNLEKIYKKRDIFNAGLKSAILTLSMFYVIFFFIFGWWIGNNGAYETEALEPIIPRTMAQLGISLGTIALTIIMMITIQRDSQVGRRFANRFRRR